MKMMKRVLAFALMLCILGSFLVIPDVAQAADYKGKTQTFQIRESETYDKLNVTVKMTSTSKDGKTGTILFQGNAKLKDTAGRTVGYFNKGVVYDYKISSLKNKGTITLTYNDEKSGGAQPPSIYMEKIEAKIHIDKSKGCKIANIWKIDTLKYKPAYGSKNRIYVYFRND